MSLRATLHSQTCASFRNEMEKRFEKYIFKTDNETFFIEEDLPEVGWYLYRFDRNGQCTHDYLQDSKDHAIKFALDQFQIPINSWNVES